jgi:hypothetical protein
MSLDQNLANGQLAVTEARKYISGSSNRRSDRIAHGGGIEAIIAARTGFSTTLIQAVEDSRAQASGTHMSSNPALWLLQTANGARGSGAGNCGELAAIAYQYLKSSHITPIDYMQFSAPGYDHVWVIIGRAANSDLTHLKTWGDEAVWCDAWQGDDGVVFSVQDFVKGKVRNLNAIFKCNTAELVEAGVPVVVSSA